MLSINGWSGWINGNCAKTYQEEKTEEEAQAITRVVSQGRVCCVCVCVLKMCLFVACVLPSRDVCMRVRDVCALCACCVVYVCCLNCITDGFLLFAWQTQQVRLPSMEDCLQRGLWNKQDAYIELFVCYLCYQHAYPSVAGFRSPGNLPPANWRRTGLR